MSRKVRRDSEILAIGNQMSNVFFNLRQRPSCDCKQWDEFRDIAAELQPKWGAAKRIYLDSFKSKKKGKP